MPPFTNELCNNFDFVIDDDWSSQPQSKGKLQQSAKVVSFNEGVKVIEVPSLKKLSPEEKAELWVTDEEFQSTQKKCCALLQKAHIRSTTEGAKIALPRGLEQYTKNNIKERLTTTISLLQVIVKIQNLQEKVGVQFPEMMADLCQDLTAASQEAAYNRALYDAKRV